MSFSLSSFYRLLLSAAIVLWAVLALIYILPVAPVLSYFLSYFGGIYLFTGIIILIAALYLLSGRMRLTLCTCLLALIVLFACLWKPFLYSDDSHWGKVANSLSGEFFFDSCQDLRRFDALSTPSISEAEYYGKSVCGRLLSFLSTDGSRTQVLVVVSEEVELRNMVRQSTFWRDLRRVTAMIRHSTDPSLLVYSSRDPIRSPNIQLIEKMAQVSLQFSHQESRLNVLLTSLFPRYLQTVRVRYFINSPYQRNANDKTIRIS